MSAATADTTVEQISENFAGNFIWTLQKVTDMELEGQHEMSFASKLAVLLTMESDMKQTEIAELVGLTQGNISRMKQRWDEDGQWNRDREPTLAEKMIVELTQVAAHRRDRERETIVERTKSALEE